ncbi:MAG: aldo/keto reductase [Verrucomicrobia bacterium]|nr:MAG: aldo/keto reductase [Verrucomicrobiota bacterium]
MQTVTLPCGERVPAFGMGTWHFGDDARTRQQEIATLRLGLDLGARLIDTAEMYGGGRAEEIVGEAIRDRRDEVFLVSKVLPSHATRHGTKAACERSLRFLKTDRIDLYLLHWHESVPVLETIAGFKDLQREGKIRHFGVSNLDLDEMKEWWTTPGGDQAQTNQLLYNLVRRGIEWDLLPWLREHKIPVMAYSPIEQAQLVADKRLIGFARHHGMTTAQAALGWLLSKKDVIVIPKTSNPERLKENFGALEHPLSKAQIAELEELFPAPKEPKGLEML